MWILVLDVVWRLVVLLLMMMILLSDEMTVLLMVFCLLAVFNEVLLMATRQAAGWEMMLELLFRHFVSYIW